MLKQHLEGQTTSNMLSTFRPFVFNIWTGRGRNRSNPRRNRASQRGPRRRRNHPIFACDYANPRLWVAMDTDLEVHRDRDTSVVPWQRTWRPFKHHRCSHIAITAFRCTSGARSAPGDFFQFFNMWTTFRPDFRDQHFNMWTTFRREIANIQHQHLGRSKTTSCVSLRCSPRPPPGKPS